MLKDVHDYVTHCQKCQVNKAECLKADGLLQPLEIPNGNWKSISKDSLLDYLLPAMDMIPFWVIVNRLTKMCQFVPTKTTIKTPELARLFVENVYRGCMGYQPIL